MNCSKCGKAIKKFMAKSKRCQSCRSAAHREYCQRVGYHKKRYAKEAKAERERHLVKKYGVTQADYEKMFDAQSGQCAICQKKQLRPFDVDHCHITGKVRGLLCTNCNRMLGHAHDNPERLLEAANYLSSRKSRQNLSKQQCED